MVSEKRGLWVVIALIIVFSLVLVAAVEETSGQAKLKKYNSLVKEVSGQTEGCGIGMIGFDDSKYKITHGNTCGGPGAAQYQDYSNCNDDGWVTCKREKVGDCDCDDDSEWWDNTGTGHSNVAPKGCYIRAHDSGTDWGDAECAWMEMKEGAIIKKESKQEAAFIFGSDYYQIGGDSESKCPLRVGIFYTPSEVSYVCGDDHFWYECNANTPQNAVTWGNNSLSVCMQLGSEGADYYEWVPLGEDKDHDGFIAQITDCMDAPDSNCPLPPIKDYAGLNHSELQEQIKEKYCSNHQNFQCAICINPLAPETCGDGLNNDCKGGADVKTDDDETSDDCNQNQYACSQEPPIPGVNDQLSPQQQYNIYNQPFAYIKTKEGGFCCGYNSTLNDQGKVVSTNVDESYLCVNKNLVGSELDFTQWASRIPLKGGEDWYLLKASDVDAQYRVLTLKVPGNQSYDVVSDSLSWQTCNAQHLGDLTIGNNPVYANNVIPNRFTCYQEGQHWSWAECYGQTAQHYNPNVKGRVAGDGTYSLYLGSNTKLDETGDIMVEWNSISITSLDGLYNDFYQLAQDKISTATAKFDFSGYDTLEFFVRFVPSEGSSSALPAVKLPVDIHVSFFGPKGVDKQGKDLNNELFFEQRTLGYVENGPLFGKDNWMHVKMPIPSTLQGVSYIKIIGQPQTEQNKIQVKNVYLSQSGSQTKICSGKDDSARSSWLTSFDDGAPGLINAEDMCKSHFGLNAWLGNNEEVFGIGAETASCCGNDKNEYFSGTSKSGYGCWNSQPIAPGATTTNVEFKVEYQEENFSISYPIDQKAEYTLTPTYTLDLDAAPEENSGTSVKYHTPTKSDSQPISYGVTRLSEDFSSIPESKNYQLQLLNGSTVQARYILTELKLDQGGSSPGTRIFFFNILTGELVEEKLSRGDLASGIKNFVLVAENRQANSAKTSSVTLTKTLNYPCDQESCYFPLPGEPDYKITNPHPELYELYFISEDPKEKEPVLINSPNQTFKHYGIIQAKKAAQQIIYVNTEAPKPANSTEEESAAPEQGFFGCQAASYLVGGNLLNDKTNLPYCNIKGNMFCSPTVNHTNGNEKYTTINSWSNEILYVVGYEEPQEGEQNALDFFANFELKLKDTLILPTQRNYTAPLLPGRNFLPNANFVLKKDELPHWEISPQPITMVLKEKVLAQSTDNYLVKLSDGEILRSEKIALFPNQKLHFSQNLTCGYQIILVDKDGILLTKNEADFETGNSAYLIVEFIGPGEVFQPQLQLVDDLGPAGYSPNDKYNDKNSARSGAACCPDNHCWNGYACVEDMSKFTSLVDQVEGGRFYRCVDGNWSYFPPKRDWTNDLMKWGFCPKQEQCFVLSHNFGGDKSYTAQDFYQGKYPTCINSGEYIFDHYCENGNWTSRTKFLASKLLEVIDEGDDYELYCDNYQQALLDFAEKDNYLGGTISQQVATNTDDLLDTEITTQSVSTCFDKIMDGEGKRLIQDDENLHENTCINNVCVLKYKESGKIKVAFATTLNKPINDSSSFFLALDVPLSGLDKACPLQGVNDVTEFVHCNLDTELGDLWYAPKLNAIIFAKDGISLSPSFFGQMIDKAVGWLKDLFGVESQLSSESKFVNAAENYHQLYLSNHADKKVRALQEYFSTEKQTLIAEYENYETPVCDYLLNLKTPPELNVELFKEVSGEGKLNCSTQDAIQRVEAIAGLKFLWPQLTANLRAEMK